MGIAKDLDALIETYTRPLVRRGEFKDTNTNGEHKRFCSICKQWKPIAEYHKKFYKSIKQGKRVVGYQSSCKPCMVKIVTKRRKERARLKSS